MNALQLVLSILRGKTFFPVIEMAPNVQEKVKQILGKRLPIDVVFREDYYDDGYEWISDSRWLPARGMRVEALHVVNNHVQDVVEYVRDFTSIEGEVCFSGVVDNHHHRRRSFLGIVMSGELVAGHSVDMWSDTCPLTGRRICLSDRQGADRVEDWMVPAKCKLQKVVTNCYDLLKELDAAGIPAEFWTKHEDDPREWDLAAEWDSDWA